jgi:hypothetical protein
MCSLGGSLAGGIGMLRHGPGSTGMEVGRISAAAGVDTALKQDETGGFGLGGIESTGQVPNPMRGVVLCHAAHATSQRGLGPDCPDAWPIRCWRRGRGQR